MPSTSGPYVPLPRRPTVRGSVGLTPPGVTASLLKHWLTFRERDDGFWQKVRDSEYGQFTIIAYNNLFIELGGKHNHFITCPVCENETTFWRESPWPVATLTREDGRPLPLSVRAMLEELENAKAEE